MNSVEALHNEAMDLAELAHIAKTRNDHVTFLELLENSGDTIRISNAANRPTLQFLGQGEQVS